MTVYELKLGADGVLQFTELDKGTNVFHVLFIKGSMDGATDVNPLGEVPKSDLVKFLTVVTAGGVSIIRDNVVKRPNRLKKWIEKYLEKLGDALNLYITPPVYNA